VLCLVEFKLPNNLKFSRKSHDDSESYLLVGVEFWHVFGELFVVKVLLAVNIHL